jgi:hypothetical protein
MQWNANHSMQSIVLAWVSNFGLERVGAACLHWNTRIWLVQPDVSAIVSAIVLWTYSERYARGAPAEAAAASKGYAVPLPVLQGALSGRGD